MWPDLCYLIITMKLLLTLSVLVTGNLSAVNYTADFTAGVPGQPALFLDSSEHALAPVGSVIWFVAGQVAAGKVPLSAVQAWHVVGTATTPGNYPAVLGPGVATCEVSDLPPEVASQEVSVILWNDNNHNGIIGDAGDTFGVYQLAALPAPEFGNAIWTAGPIHADENTVIGPMVSIARAGEGIAVSFTGTLQTADSPLGPWFDWDGIESPLIVSPAAGQKFYRAR